MRQAIRTDETAVIVIDMVNDYFLPGDVGQGEGTRQVIDNTVRLLTLARSKRLPIIFIRDCGRHLRRGDPAGGDGDWGAQILTELAPQPQDIVVAKSRYDAFLGTNLDRILRRLGVRNLIFAGVFTSACVLTTVAHARSLDYRNCVVSDCTGDYARQRHENVLKIIGAFFARISSLRETAILFGLGEP